VKRRLRQLLGLLTVVAIGCSADPMPRPLLRTPSGASPLDAFYGVFFEPLEGGTTDVELVLLLVDPSWGCGNDAGTVDAVGFGFPMRASPPVTSMVLSRSGPRFGATSGGSGEVRLSAVDDRYQGDGPTGPIVAAGGKLEGHVYFELAAGLLLDGDFRAPHCALLDFRNAN
jgi:hypothetical protein